MEGSQVPSRNVQLWNLFSLNYDMLVLLMNVVLQTVRMTRGRTIFAGEVFSRSNHAVDLWSLLFPVTSAFLLKCAIQRSKR